VGSGGDALGNDREGGDLELSDWEWDGWMLDLDQQRYVERARAELGHKSQTPARGGGSVKPPSSSTPPSRSSAKSLSHTLAMTTSFLALTTIPHNRHHPSRSLLSVDEGSNTPTTSAHMLYLPIRDIVTSTVNASSKSTHTRQHSSTVRKQAS